jgi:glycosyltransferase involved in cell wall biosynthesis
MKPKLVILTNLVAPYRVPVYRHLGERFSTVVAVGKAERNRVGWEHQEETLREAGVRVEVVSGRTFTVAEAKYLHVDPGYFTVLLREKPDAIISLEMGVRTLCALAYSSLMRTPVWIWWGGTPYSERTIGGAKKAIRRYVARRNVRWISYGMESSQYLRSLNISDDRIVQIQNAVDERLFTCAEPGDRSALPVLLVVGQLIERKGLEPLLRSAQRVQARGDQFVLRLVGSGPRREALEEMVAEAGLRNVEFVGSVRPLDMPREYQAADVLVFPTLEDVWGLAVNEALLCGRPVVCSRYAGCASELLDPENIFDPNDDSDFDRALARAARREVSLPKEDRLWPIDRVGATIADSISEVLDSRREKGKRRGAGSVV